MGQVVAKLLAIPLSHMFLANQMLAVLTVLGLDVCEYRVNEELWWLTRSDVRLCSRRARFACVNGGSSSALSVALSVAMMLRSF